MGTCIYSKSQCLTYSMSLCLSSWSHVLTSVSPLSLHPSEVDKINTAELHNNKCLGTDLLFFETMQQCIKVVSMSCFKGRVKECTVSTTIWCMFSLYQCWCTLESSPASIGVIGTVARAHWSPRSHWTLIIVVFYNSISSQRDISLLAPRPMTHWLYYSL